MIEARGAGSGAGTDSPPGRRNGGREGGAKPKLLFGATALVVVLALAAGAVFLLGGGDDKAAGPPPEQRIEPTAYTPDFGDEGTTAIAKRAADPRELTVEEVFGADTKTVKGGGLTFALTGTHLSKDCKAVSWGAVLQQDLAKAQCRAIVRGAYLSADKRFSGQFIAIDLADAAGVQQILRSLDPANGAGFVLPLNPEGAPPFVKGFSSAFAQARGHYAVLAWVQKAGGADPASLNELLEASLPIEYPVDFVWVRVQMADGRR
ncbi:hypothetical protein [Actinomadura flavalba]|uniref:hypothetical protein n=1 Tax=Actinomadura flavalba TaxID=1120938 RepID=UPI00036CE051|nr:hypothetical protein [Actinomadura flavalba]